jgi:phenylalanine-4-hydroxylase
MMTAKTIDSPTLPDYTEQDHAVWATLYARQMPALERRACRLFHDGFPRLGLDPLRLPDPAAVSEQLHDLTGWTLGDAQNAYLGRTEWFEHIYERRFPVTNYIRGPHEIAFTPMPDLFHEYIGHLAFFTDRAFADMAQSFGPLYMAADERQQVEISRLWWFTTEFGLLYEGGELRALGAGLLSSIAEMERAFAPHTRRLPFDVRAAATMPSAVHEMHETYFILEGVGQIAAILDEYAAQEGLPR